MLGLKSRLFQRSLLSLSSLSCADIQQILAVANAMECQHPLSIPLLLEGKIIASCFFEPSTRTRLSFASAILRLGGQIIGFDSPEYTSIKKGESLADTSRMLRHYADAIIIRHPYDGAPKWVQHHSHIPVINAGDGGHQHPTQTLLDLMSIRATQGHLHGLRISFVGDLRFGRTVHSLLAALQHVPCEFCLYPIPGLELPEYVIKQMEQTASRFDYVDSMTRALEGVDIIYMTRVQRERLHNTIIPNDLSPWQLREKHMQHAKKNLKILHPLPRTDEIDTALDSSPHAYYFQQSRHGVSVRQAILCLLLNEHIPIDLPIEDDQQQDLEDGFHDTQPIPSTSPCFNPMCVSNQERHVPQLKNIHHHCYYCDHL